LISLLYFTAHIKLFKVNGYSYAVNIEYFNWIYERLNLVITLILGKSKYTYQIIRKLYSLSLELNINKSSF